MATAHIVPFDVGLHAGWSEARIHHLANLLLLCARCHLAFDRRPGWAFQPEIDCRPNTPEWANEYRLADLLSLAIEHYPEMVRAALAKGGSEEEVMTTPDASTPTADGQDAQAPADMGAACVEAVDAAISQRVSEGTKVAMGGV